MKQSLFIEQIMVIGEGQKMPAALIQPAFEYVEAWAQKNNIDVGKDLQSICQSQALIEAINDDINEHNQNFENGNRSRNLNLHQMLGA